MSLGRQVTREAVIYAAGTVASAGLQFLAIPVYTRVFGPQEYSQWALTIATTSALSGLMVVGGDVALSRFWFGAKDVEERRDLTVSWIVALTLWSSIVAVVACLFAEPLTIWLGGEAGFSRLFIVGTITLVPAQLSRMLAQVLRNGFRPVAFATTSVVVGAGALTLGLTFGVILGFGVVGVLLGALIAEVVGCLVRFPLVWSELRGRLRWSAIAPMLHFGIPFIPASVSYWVFTGADRIIVSRDLGPTALGQYSAAAMLVMPFTLLSIAIGQAWLPRITQQYEESRPDAARSVSRALLLSVAGWGILAVVVAALSPWVITLVSGPEFLPGSRALPFLCLASVWSGTSLFAGTGFTLAKRSKLFPVVAIAAAVVNVLLLQALVASFELVGAAVGVALTYLLLALGLLALSERYFPVAPPWLRLFLLCVVITGQCTLATFSTGWGLITAPLAIVAILLTTFHAPRRTLPALSV